MDAAEDKYDKKAWSEFEKRRRLEGPASSDDDDDSRLHENGAAKKNKKTTTAATEADKLIAEVEKAGEDHDHDDDATPAARLKRKNEEAKNEVTRVFVVAGMRSFIKHDIASQKAHKLIAPDAKTPCSEEALKTFIPRSCDCDDLLYRFAITRDNNFQSASKRFYKFCGMLNELGMGDFRVVSPEVREAASMGFHYVGRDVLGRPVMNFYTDEKTYNWKKTSPHNMKLATVHFLMKLMMDQGEYYAQFGGVVFVSYLCGWGASQMCDEYDRWSMEILTGCFPGKVGGNIMVEGGFMLEYLFWPIFKRVMSKKLVERSVFVSSKKEKETRKLHDRFSPDMIPAEYGGTCEYDEATYIQTEVVDLPPPVKFALEHFKTPTSAAPPPTAEGKE